MTWLFKEQDTNLVEEYKEALKVDDIAASILINRKMGIKDASFILEDPKALLQDPFLMVNMEQGVKEIIQAIEEEKELWVFGDYDVDGITSGYTLTDFLRKTTNNPTFVYYPERSEGYAISMDFCKKMVERERETGKKVFIITVDNGTSCIDEVRYLKENGIGIVVTDHHKGKETLPDCTVINPHISDGDIYHHLCGCGVAYKVIEAIQRYAKLKQDYASQYLFAVALGTVADVMPMTQENMAFVMLGLRQINSPKCPVAFKKFKKYIGKNKINSSSIAWDISPRLNACGRLGEIHKGASLFFMNDEDTSSEIMDIIIEIEEINESRKALTKKATKEAEKEDYSNDAICLFDASDYPPGIAGIIAGKICEQEGKPAIVYSGEDEVTGSARSPEWLNLQSLFEEKTREGVLIGYGGHEQAAGVRIKRSDLERFKESANEYVLKVMNSLASEVNKGIESTLEIDKIISLGDLNKKVYESIHTLPYDKNAFTQPTFAITNLDVLDVRSSKNNPDNICLRLEDAKGQVKEIWAWRFGEKYKLLGSPAKIDLAGLVDQNFMNKSQYTLNVVDIRESEAI